MDLTHPLPRSLTAAGLALRCVFGAATLMGAMLLPAPAYALQGEDEPATALPSEDGPPAEDPAGDEPADESPPPDDDDECPEGALCENPDPCVGTHCGPPPGGCPEDTAATDEDCVPPCPPQPVPLQSSPSGDRDCPEDPCVEVEVLSLTVDRHGPDPDDCPEDPCPERENAEHHRDDEPTDGDGRHHPERPEHPDPEDCPDDTPECDPQVEECDPPRRTPDPDPVDPPVVAEPTFTG